MARIRVWGRPRPGLATRFGFVLLIGGCLFSFREADAGKATTGNWIGPFSMGHTPADTYTQARATHMTVLRRQTTFGDSTLVVHWHDRSRIRAWTYAYGADGTFLADTTNTARARILSDPVHNVFCAGHVNLLDGRLLVVGGTAPNTGGELGTTEVVTLDPNQPNLWTSTNNWVVQDSMKHDRWYPTATNMADGTVLANSGLEYREMPVIGGSSPQDSTGPFRQLRSLGLNRFPSWPVEPMNLDPPATQHPKLRDHSSIFTSKQQKRADGRGMIVSFGGIDETGQPTSSTWQTWEVPVDAHHSWRTEPMPLTAGSPLPPARSQHAAGIVEIATGLNFHELRMVIYGGLDASGNAMGDVWLLSKPNNNDAATWQQIFPTPPSAEQAPGPRYGHTMVFDPGVEPGPAGPTMYYPKMYVFGGKRNPQTWAGTDTVWVLELWGSYAWHPLVPSGSKPPPRYRAAAVFDREARPGQTRMRMSIFGGAGDGGGAPSPLLSDTWTLSRSLTDYEYASWVWYQNPANLAGTAPGVYKHSMVHDEEWNRLLVFGGDRSSEGVSAETNTGDETDESFVRTLDISSADSAWRKLATTSPPVRRSGHSAVYYWSKIVNARPPERFDPLAPPGQRWSELSNSPKFDLQTYPFMFALTDGRLFYAGRSDSSEVLAANATGPWGDTKLAALSASAIARETAVQYSPGKVIKVGSDGTNGIANLATFTGSNYTWSNASSVGLLSRGNPNSTILPNGQVLVTGGRMWHALANHNGSNNSPAVQTPQAWTPSSNVWTSGALALADEPAVRGYHSTAILLPDARVLSAGGNPGTPADDFYLGTIFEPPYLFDPASTGGNGYATRPTIDAAPRWIGHDCTFKLTVTSASGVSGVCLIRAGAPTHAFNQDQVYVPLGFTQSGSDVTVTEPAGPYIAPPGDYMLFVLDNSTQKVPSVARWVRVGEAIWPYQASDVTRPGRIVNLNGQNGLNGPPSCSRPIRLTWTNQSDDSTFASSGRSRRLDLRYSMSAICDNCWSAFAWATQVCEPPPGMPNEAQSMEIAGLEIGAYQFRMVGQDDGTNPFSAMSNAKSVSVMGCEEDGFYAGGGGGGESFGARSAGTMSMQGPSGGFEESPLLAATGGGPVSDLLRLINPRVEGNQVHVRLRRGSSGETQVQKAVLLAVDHPSTSEVFRVGDRWRLGERHPATSARGVHGEEFAGLLLGDPASFLVGNSGDTIVITLPPAATNEDGGALYLTAQSGRIADVAEPGLRVLERDTAGTWREAARILPRPRFSTLALSGIAGNEVGLVFVGNHAVSAVGRLVVGDTVPAFTQPAVTLLHSRLGELDPTSMADGGAGVTLEARDTVEVKFDMPGAASNGGRDWYLHLTGSSTEGSVLASRARPSSPDPDVPVALRFEAARPNPFAVGTKFRLGLPEAGAVRLEIFDLAGRRVATPAKERLSAGWHEISWDGRSRSGDRVAPGIYLCRLITARRTLDRKVVYSP